MVGVNQSHSSIFSRYSNKMNTGTLRSINENIARHPKDPEFMQFQQSPHNQLKFLPV
jgi:hypothetical protein